MKLQVMALALLTASSFAQDEYVWLDYALFSPDQLSTLWVAEDGYGNFPLTATERRRFTSEGEVFSDLFPRFQGRTALRFRGELSNQGRAVIKYRNTQPELAPLTGGKPIRSLLVTVLNRGAPVYLSLLSSWGRDQAAAIGVGEIPSRPTEVIIHMVPNNFYGIEAGAGFSLPDLRLEGWELSLPSSAGSDGTAWYDLTILNVRVLQ